MLYLSGALGILVAIGHSIVGERVIFQPLRLMPYADGVLAHTEYQRLFWALWHFPSVVWFGMGALALHAALTGMPLGRLLPLMAGVYAFSGLANLYSFRTIHAGWILLLGNALILIAVSYFDDTISS